MRRRHSAIHTPYFGFLRDMLRTQYSRTETRGQGHNDKMVCHTLRRHDVSTYEIRESYLKEYRKYIPETIILELRPDIKLKVTVIQNGT